LKIPTPQSILLSIEYQPLELKNHNIKLLKYHRNVDLKFILYHRVRTFGSRPSNIGLTMLKLSHKRNKVRNDLDPAIYDHQTGQIFPFMVEHGAVNTNIEGVGMIAMQLYGPDGLQSCASIRFKTTNQDLQMTIQQNNVLLHDCNSFRYILNLLF
jgi:hypothetical protein